MGRDPFRDRRGWRLPPAESGLSERVAIADAMEAIAGANELLYVARNEPNPYRAMALVVATLATHGRMQRLLADIEGDSRVARKVLARAREWLGLFADTVRSDPAEHPATIERCGRYLDAAQGELQRIGKALVAAMWKPDPRLPGRWSALDTAPPT